MGLRCRPTPVSCHGIVDSVATGGSSALPPGVDPIRSVRGQRELLLRQCRGASGAADRCPRGRGPTWCSTTDQVPIRNGRPARMRTWPSSSTTHLFWSSISAPTGWPPTGWTWTTDGLTPAPVAVVGVAAGLRAAASGRCCRSDLVALAGELSGEIALLATGSGDRGAVAAGHRAGEREFGAERTQRDRRPPPTARFVVIANRGPDTVASFAIEHHQGGAHLRPVDEISCGGAHPRALTLIDDLLVRRQPARRQRRGAAIDRAGPAR